MIDHEKELEEEINELRQEIEDFRKEKERVRLIVGRIGGVPTFNSRVFNIIFVIAIFFCLIISVFTRDTLRLIALEVAIAAISAKLIYIMHNQARVNHFELWILSSLEWRINELHKKMNKLYEEIAQEGFSEQGDE